MKILVFLSILAMLGGRAGMEFGITSEDVSFFYASFATYGIAFFATILFCIVEGAEDFCIEET